MTLASIVALAVAASPSGAAPGPGPAVGARIPSFSAVDQAGATRTFDSLRGEKGLVLVFFRSADW